MFLTLDLIMRPTRPRIKIKVPKRAAPLELSTTWTELLQPALRQIYNKDSSLLSFEALNNAVYRLVNQQHGKTLYRRYGDDLREYLEVHRSPGVLANVSGDLITYIARLWDEHVFSMKLVGDILRYLNQSYCKEADVPSVEQLGEVIFRDKILRLPVSGSAFKTVEAALFAQIVAAINDERRGGSPEPRALKQVIEMLLSIPFEESGLTDCIFMEQLEPMIVESTIDFYSPELEHLIDSGTDGPAVLETLQSWLNQEHSRGERFLPKSTRENIQTVLKTRIVSEAIPRIMSVSLVAHLMETQNINHIKLAAELEYSTKPTSSAVVAKIGEWAQTNQAAHNHGALASYTGKTASDVVRIWIEKTLALHELLENVGKELFHVFECTINAPVILISTWAAMLNKFDASAAEMKLTVTCSEFLAHYLDDILKKSPKARSEAEMETGLRQAAIVYEALVDKDRFGKDYRLLLARRLLNNRIQSEELEAVFVDRMRRIGGPSSTANIENMFKDMQISKEFNHDFRKQYNGVPTQVNVVRNNFWPASVTKEKLVALPLVLDEAKHAFEEYYLSKTSGRKLRWNMGFCTAELVLRVPAGIYSVTVNVGTLAVLMLFKGDEQLTLAQVSDQTRIDMSELERIVPPLVFAPKSQLLLKQPADRKMLPTDILTFNTNFKSSSPRIRIVNLSAGSRADAEKQRQEVAAEVRGDRSMAVQAAIVRVMKARKELSHALLVETVSAMLARQFRASPASIKREIGELIDTEYLRRSDTDPSVYIYIS